MSLLLLAGKRGPTTSRGGGLRRGILGVLLEGDRPCRGPCLLAGDGLLHVLLRVRSAWCGTGVWGAALLWGLLSGLRHTGARHGAGDGTCFARNGIFFSLQWRPFMLSVWATLVYAQLVVEVSMVLDAEPELLGTIVTPSLMCFRFLFVLCRLSGLASWCACCALCRLPPYGVAHDRHCF